ncbi:alpha/beta fold hydrolase [Paenibacillus piri]|nr:alpha/beta hydrolase [Paenibacillus piri]
MPFVHHNNYPIYYEYHIAEEGHSKETLVFIHGIGLNLRTWDYLIPFLQADFNVLCLDIRGHGKSSCEESIFHWDELCTDLYVLLRELGLSEVHLVGHGLGGTYAVCFTNRYPRLVKKLVLISTLAFYPAEIIEQAKQFRQTLFKPGNVRPLAEHLIQLITIKPLSSPAGSLLMDAYQQARFDVYFGMIDLFLRTEPVEDLKLLKLPTLVIAGELDVLFPHYLSGITSSYIMNSTFLVIPDASNMTFIDEPGHTATIMNDFISKDSHATKKINTDDPWVNIIQAKVANHIMEGRPKEVPFRKLNVQLMKGFKVYVNNSEVLHGWNQRLAKRLFVYLIFHPSTIRENLYNEFWPETNAKQSSNYLSVCLNHLKQLLKTDDAFSFLVVNREHVYLQGEIECDLLSLNEKMNRFFAEPDTSHKKHIAEEIIHFFSDHVKFDIYDNWFLETLDTARGKLRKVVVWLILAYEQSQEEDKIISCIENVLPFQPDYLEYYDQLIQIYQTRGIRSLASKWIKKKQQAISEYY